MPIHITVAPVVMAAMALVGVFTLILPLGLALFFGRKTRGQWKFFLTGCAVFFLFALVLEQTAHGFLLYGVLGPVLSGNIWLYALYGGMMAGIFEECGRWLAFKLFRQWSRGPEDALMYGAGHGGIEAILLVGVTMVNNIILSLALNQGGLDAIEALMGPVPEESLAAIQSLAVIPAGAYFWTGFERLVAVGLHIALSVLVYTAVVRKDRWYLFPVAILLHTLVDMAAILINTYSSIAATEAVVALLTLGAILLARKVYLKQRLD